MTSIQLSRSNTRMMTGCGWATSRRCGRSRRGRGGFPVPGARRRSAGGCRADRRAAHRRRRTPDANPNLDYVLTDTVRLIEQLRNEGRTVLVHCVAAQSRTPTVAALYCAHRQGISGKAALRDVTSVLPNAYPNSDFHRALKK